MFTSTKFLMTLTAIATATTLAACEDNITSMPAPKPSTTVTAEPIKTPTPPETTPVAVPPPSTNLETGVKKEEPVIDKVEAPTPANAIDGARKVLADGDLEGAFKMAKVAVLKTPKRSAAWNTLGRVQLQMGKRKEAIASFEKAVELNPRNSYAQNNLGLALIYDKRFSEAVDALENAVELEPVEGYMWNNLGMAYEQLDRLEEARDAYGKAMEMDNGRAKESLARLKGVKSVVRTARVETDVKTTGDTGTDTTPSTTTDQPPAGAQ
jgi:Tfp pilus assembly protein PilF